VNFSENKNHLKYALGKLIAKFSLLCFNNSFAGKEFYQSAVTHHALSTESSGNKYGNY